MPSSPSTKKLHDYIDAYELRTSGIGSNFSANWATITVHFVFKMPTPTPMAFTGVTNAHGPSPKPTACSLMTGLGSNQAQRKV